MAGNCQPRCPDGQRCVLDSNGPTVTPFACLTNSHFVSKLVSDWHSIAVYLAERFDGRKAGEVEVLASTQGDKG
jgi:hypothetical protein